MRARIVPGEQSRSEFHLLAAKKQFALGTHGGPGREVFGFDFTVSYGKLGDGRRDPCRAAVAKPRYELPAHARPGSP